MIVTIANQKGGVGKTTLVLNLAFLAAEEGKRVLCIDLDTQGSLSGILTGDPAIRSRSGGASTLFSDVGNMELDITHTSHGIDLLHGHAELDDLDTLALEYALSKRDSVRAMDYDIILIDTPPAIGLRQLAPLLYADVLVIPLPPEEMPVLGLSSMLETATLAKQVNPDLRARIILSRVKRSSSSHAEISEQLHEQLGAMLMNEQVRERVAVTDAATQRVPVWKAKNADKILRDEWRSMMASLLTIGQD